MNKGTIYLLLSTFMLSQMNSILNIYVGYLLCFRYKSYSASFNAM